MSVEYPLFARKYVGALPDTLDADEVGKSFGLWVWGKAWPKGSRVVIEVPVAEIRMVEELRTALRVLHKEHGDPCPYPNCMARLIESEP